MFQQGFQAKPSHNVSTRTYAPHTYHIYRTVIGVLWMLDSVIFRPQPVAVQNVALGGKNFVWVRRGRKRSQKSVPLSGCQFTSLI